MGLSNWFPLAAASKLPTMHWYVDYMDNREEHEDQFLRDAALERLKQAILCALAESTMQERKKTDPEPFALRQAEQLVVANTRTAVVFYPCEDGPMGVAIIGVDHSERVRRAVEAWGALGEGPDGAFSCLCRYIWLYTPETRTQVGVVASVPPSRSAPC